MNKNWINHNSHSLFYRSPFGSLACGQEVTLRLTVSPEKLSVKVFLILEKEGEGKTETEMFPRKGTTGDPTYEISYKAPHNPGLVWYYFRVEEEGEGKGNIWFCGSQGFGQGGTCRIGHKEAFPYQITIHKEGAVTPHWFKDAVVYQIFPDRFYNGCLMGRVLKPKKNSLIHAHWDNEPVYIRQPETGAIDRWDFFGGNLYGVLKKLPYLKRLGVNIIYFNPIFESPSNHRYDTADYHRVDPMLGNNQFFAFLCQRAKDLGISVILDGVFSHTGSDSIYFNREGNYSYPGAYQSQESPYYKWYRFKSFPHEYESWWGIHTMPNVDELEPSYQDFIISGDDSVIKHWMNLGVVGWRLDVADELPGEFIRNLRMTMKEINKESVLIGEVWEDASNKISYGERRSYLLGEELDAVMNYPFRNILIDFLQGRQCGNGTCIALTNLAENYPKENFYANMNLLGSHDQPRILTILSQGLCADMPEWERQAATKGLFKVAVLWQMTFPGTPSVYYGDEAGLEGGDDPMNRRTYPWGREDKEMLNFYREMIALRQHYDVLRTGDWHPLYGEGDVFCYLRSIEGGEDTFSQKKKDNAAVIFLNRNLWEARTVEIDISSWFADTAIDVLADYQQISLKDGKLQITLQPLEGKILLRDRWGDNYDYQRECGVLLHPTSLPGPFGIGSLGDEALAFVDFLQKSGQRFWQILPLNPPGYGDSPYQCYSAFAGNHLLIDLDRLVVSGLLKKEDLQGVGSCNSGDMEAAISFSEDHVEFDKVAECKEELLRKAFKAFQAQGGGKDYDNFLTENEHWLPEYALYMALKAHFGGECWVYWEKKIALREDSALQAYQQKLALDIDYHKFLQFTFFTQWHNLKRYAHDKGVHIIGDLPIFVSHDSSDVWTNPHLFELDDAGNPTKIAGVPPDYFSETGQLWGNPHYRWDEMAKDDYKWWRDRFDTLSQMVDIIRVDHFRGFEAYWEVAGGEKTAQKGRWVKGPGEKFFRVIQKHLGHIQIIAEDLGIITPEVEDLKEAFGYPGMKIIQFILEEFPEKEYSLPLADKNTFVYTGTHDNDTMLGWYKEKYPGHKDLSALTDEEICWYFIERAYRSNARAVVIPLQDILSLDSNSRMNIPGTAEGNWHWRLSKGNLTNERAERLKKLAEKYSFNRTKAPLPEERQPV